MLRWIKAARQPIGHLVAAIVVPVYQLISVAEVNVPSRERYTRRLSDKIMIAFDHACDEADFEVAGQLLSILETMMTRPPQTASRDRRRAMEILIASHERLWVLKHPEPQR